MKTLLAFALAVVLTGCASAPTPPVARPSVEWRYVRATSYEVRTPGLGTSRRYESAAGWADVYSYGLRRSDWAPGVDDPSFGAHFESTVAEVHAYAKHGIYRNLQVGPVRDVVVADNVFRTIDYRFVLNGNPMFSTTYLTSTKGGLLKYRVSSDLSSRLDLEVEARAFVAENLREGALEPARKTEHDPTRPAGQAPPSGSTLDRCRTDGDSDSVQTCAPACASPVPHRCSHAALR